LPPRGKRPSAFEQKKQIGASTSAEMYRLALVAQTLLVTVFLHSLPPLVLGDFGFPSLFE
jgi:hypothetical protein